MLLPCLEQAAPATTPASEPAVAPAPASVPAPAPAPAPRFSSVCDGGAGTGGRLTG